MTITSILQTIKSVLADNGAEIAIIVAIIFSIIEVAPLKLNPWKLSGKFVRWILSTLGKYMMSDYIVKLDEIEKKIDNVEEKVDSVAFEVDQNEIDRIRQEILNYSNKRQRGMNATKSSFLHIFEINLKYHRILQRNGLENGEVDKDIVFLEKLYAIKLESNDFLKE